MFGGQSQDSNLFRGCQFEHFDFFRLKKVNHYKVVMLKLLMFMLVFSFNKNYPKSILLTSPQKYPSIILELSQINPTNVSHTNARGEDSNENCFPAIFMFTGGHVLYNNDSQISRVDQIHP